MPQILVDADACPVKDEIITVAERHGLPVVMVANSGMRPLRNPLVRQIVVSDGFDAADDWIAENAQPGDIAVTADVPLAAKLVAREVIVIDPKGRLLGIENIGMASAMRNLNRELREAGAIAGTNAPFSRRDRSNFLQVLEMIARRAMDSNKPI